MKFSQGANAASPSPSQDPWPRGAGLSKHDPGGRRGCKRGEQMGRSLLPLCPELNQTEKQYVCVCVCGSWEMNVQLGWFKGIDALGERHPLWWWQTPDASKVVVKALRGKQLWNEMTRMQISLLLSWGRRLKQEVFLLSFPILLSFNPC